MTNVPVQVANTCNRSFVLSIIRIAWGKLHSAVAAPRRVINQAERAQGGTAAFTKALRERQRQPIVVKASIDSETSNEPSVWPDQSMWLHDPPSQWPNSSSHYTPTADVNSAAAIKCDAALRGGIDDSEVESAQQQGTVGDPAHGPHEHHAGKIGVGGLVELDHVVEVHAEVAG